MLSTAAGKASSLDKSSRDSRKSASLNRKIWLPKLFYDALPFFYLVSGALAFLATVYINEWFWVLPHYVLFSAGCIHLGVYVYRRRHRRASAESDPD